MTAKRIRPPMYRKNLRQLHRDKGVCDDCGEKATHGWYCIKHWRMAKARHKKAMRTQVDRYRVEGRCIRCGLPLDPDADASFVKCINCRERVRKAPLTFSNRRYYDYNTVEESFHAGEL